MSDSKKRIVFPKGVFQDAKFEEIFEQYYNNTTLTEHDAYREAWKHFEHQEPKSNYIRTQRFNVLK